MSASELARLFLLMEAMHSNAYAVSETIDGKLHMGDFFHCKFERAIMISLADRLLLR